MSVTKRNSRNCNRVKQAQQACTLKLLSAYIPTLRCPTSALGIVILYSLDI